MSADRAWKRFSLHYSYHFIITLITSLVLSRRRFVFILYFFVLSAPIYQLPRQARDRQTKRSQVLRKALHCIHWQCSDAAGAFRVDEIVDFQQDDLVGIRSLCWSVFDLACLLA
eukprot:COSAG06_NODE_10749_length_1623_cov_144.574803_2_plen_114_part_00